MIGDGLTVKTRQVLPMPLCFKPPLHETDETVESLRVGGIGKDMIAQQSMHDAMAAVHNCRRREKMLAHDDAWLWSQNVMQSSGAHEPEIKGKLMPRAEQALTYRTSFFRRDMAS